MRRVDIVSPFALITPKGLGDPSGLIRYRMISGRWRLPPGN